MSGDSISSGNRDDRPADLPKAQRDAPVKVNDRRIFDRTGQPRRRPPSGGSSHEPEGRRSDPMPPGPGAGTTGSQAASTVPPRSASTGSPTAGGGERQPIPEKVDFQSFVYFLYMTTLHELGVPAEPGGPSKAPDLERARFFIDILHVLESKTKGNLEPAELKLLEEVLYNLQMHFVNLSGKRTT